VVSTGDRADDIGAPAGTHRSFEGIGAGDHGHETDMKTMLAAALCSLGLALVPPAGAASANATLRFVAFSPLKVRGDGFAAGERVKATLRGNGLLRVRIVHASRGGSFVVAFGSARRARCGGALSGTAVGASGDRAVGSLPPIECPAAMP